MNARTYSSVVKALLDIRAAAMIVTRNCYYPDGGRKFVVKVRHP